MGIFYSHIYHIDWYNQFHAILKNLTHDTFLQYGLPTIPHGNRLDTLCLVWCIAMLDAVDKIF